MTMRAAIIGYGRFGAALGELLQEAGIGHRAYDPDGARVPAEVRAQSVAEVVRGARFVVLAVPVPRIADAVASVQPHLREDHIVTDVCSVKMLPTEVLRARLGDARPWVATHPLFGPTSLALGERPLRVVVCPNDLHPEAVAAVRGLWASMNCEVIEQEASAHDRVMAQTHALTFFVAKGILDAGMGDEVDYAPQSFQAISRTLDVVRGDAGHLFGAIQRDNPFTGEMRSRLIAALAQADRKLMESADEEQAEAFEASLSIPGLGQHAPALRETRELIDDLDQEIVRLLGRRAHLSRRAKAAKAGLGRAVHDPAREAEVFGARREWGRDAGIDGTSIDEIFAAIVQFSRRVQGDST